MKPDYKHLGAKGAEAASLAMGAIRTSAYLSIHQMAAHCEEDTPARTAFARAVIEEYERLRLAEVAELEASYRAMCTRLQECAQTHKLGLGGEKIDKLVVEAVANLTAENTALSAGFRTLKADREGLSQAIVSEQTKKHEALAELAKANAELERLRWRSSAVNPECGDYPIVQDNGGQKMVVESGSSLCLINAIRWVPLPKSPAPTAEEKERAEFEKACAQFDVSFTRDEGGNYRDSRTLVLFEVWQLALASKEGKA